VFFIKAAWGQGIKPAIFRLSSHPPPPRLGLVGLGLKSDFFIYAVKPEPEPHLILTYLLKFTKPTRARVQSMSPKPDPAHTAFLCFVNFHRNEQFHFLLLGEKKVVRGFC
jgi:hypothetical protein